MPFVILALAAAVAAIDQIIKYFIVIYLKPVSTVEVIPNLFSLKYVENRGAAFGILSDARWLFIAFTIIITIILIAIVFSGRIKSKLFSVSAILIIGGGVGNLIDRIFLGYVIDYLSVDFFPPVCNFADYCVTVGAILLVIYVAFFSDFGKKDMIKGE